MREKDLPPILREPALPAANGDKLKVLVCERRTSNSSGVQKRSGIYNDKENRYCSMVLAAVEKTVVGKQSRLPVPKIHFDFRSQTWFTNSAFLSRIANLVPGVKTDDALLSVGHKARESALKIFVQSANGVKALQDMQRAAKSRQARFWKTLGRVLKNTGRLGPHEINLVRKKVHQLLHRQKMRQWRISYGVVQRGGVEIGNTGALLPFQQRVVTILPNPHMAFVPPLDVRRMAPSILTRMQQIESRLKIVLRLRGGAATRDKRDSNRGMSLGRTTVTGGRHSDAAAEISGSIHMNRNLTGSVTLARESLQEGVDVHELQRDIIDCVCDCIEHSFAKATWYKAAMDKLRNIPKLRLLPGARIPASHIWWTSNPKTFHVHTDTNTLPPAFLVCATEVVGGELVCLPPSGNVSVVDTKPGTVVGGSWAQYPHCNAPVIQGERHSFVVYLDHRHASSRYSVLVGE